MNLYETVRDIVAATEPPSDPGPLHYAATCAKVHLLAKDALAEVEGDAVRDWGDDVDRLHDELPPCDDSLRRIGAQMRRGRINRKARE